VAADGLSDVEIPARLDCTDRMVAKWRKRFAAEGLAGLDERPRPGRPRSFPPERSSTRPASWGNSGSRGNTHERHAHGRIASTLSHRQTVVPETRQTIPRATASRASSAADQRDNRRPVWAGNSPTSALTSAISAVARNYADTRTPASAKNTSIIRHFDYPKRDTFGMVAVSA
jgi:hypothetical protein